MEGFPACYAECPSLHPGKLSVSSETEYIHRVAHLVLGHLSWNYGSPAIVCYLCMESWTKSKGGLSA